MRADGVAVDAGVDGADAPARARAPSAAPQRIGKRVGDAAAPRMGGEPDMRAERLLLRHRLRRLAPPQKRINLPRDTNAGREASVLEAEI